jgi:hypothetical protein
MRHRCLAFGSVLAAALLASLPAAGQATAAAKEASATKATAHTGKNWTPPKTSWGDPDIQGEWPASENIPMQRPLTLADRGTLTKAEFEAKQKEAEEQAQRDSEEFAGKSDGVTINPPSYWVEHGKPSLQTSLVVDPPNGRIPPLTPKAKAILQAERGGRGPGSHFPDVVNSWEDFDMYSRCITRGMVSSMLPTLYDFGNQILQEPGYVVIRNEMIHETRVIPLDGRPHVGSNIHMYMGDSRGHWEGNTLVVDTTNLSTETGVGGGLFSPKAHVVERFTMTGPNALSYDVTINDPETWTRPWTIHMPYKRDPSYKIYEYACHEGNYMMKDALTGARALEKEGRDTKVLRGPAGGPPPGALR